MKGNKALWKLLLLLLALAAGTGIGAWSGYSTVWVKIKEEGKFRLFMDDERFRRERFLGK